MIAFCRKLGAAWQNCDACGHALEIGHAFNERILPGIDPDVPLLARLVCNSAFDLALHDAYGNVNDIFSYDSYNARYMNRDLADYFGDHRFSGRYPEDYFDPAPCCPPPGPGNTGWP